MSSFTKVFDDKRPVVSIQKKFFDEVVMYHFLPRFFDDWEVSVEDNSITMPDYIANYENAVELKPKALIHIVKERGNKKSLFQLQQISKLAKGKINAVTNYDPFVFASNTIAGIEESLTNLRYQPQNNLRFFKGGVSTDEFDFDTSCVADTLFHSSVIPAIVYAQHSTFTGWTPIEARDRYNALSNEEKQLLNDLDIDNMPAHVMQILRFMAFRTFCDLSVFVSWNEGEEPIVRIVDVDYKPASRKFEEWAIKYINILSLNSLC
ncbi:hypothetical protein PCE1_004803 [Barthelona sp. PCE]